MECVFWTMKQFAWERVLWDEGLRFKPVLGFIILWKQRRCVSSTRKLGCMFSSKKAEFASFNFRKDFFFLLISSSVQPIAWSFFFFCYKMRNTQNIAFYFNRLLKLKITLFHLKPQSCPKMIISCPRPRINFDEFYII